MTKDSAVINIDNRILRDLLEKGVTVIDIRRKEEWKETGTIAGSHLLTLFDANKQMIEPEGWIEEVKKLVPLDNPVILVCRLGNRTIPACQLLADAGYSKVYNVTAGMAAWISEGLPVDESSLG